MSKSSARAAVVGVAVLAAMWMAPVGCGGDSHSGDHDGGGVGGHDGGIVPPGDGGGVDSGHPRDGGGVPGTDGGHDSGGPRDSGPPIDPAMFAGATCDTPPPAGAEMPPPLP